MNAERAAGPAGHNLKLKLKEDIDGLMLIVKKLRQLIDQKDEKIKELEKKKIKKNKSASFLSQCGISYDHKAKNFKMKGSKQG